MSSLSYANLDSSSTRMVLDMGSRSSKYGIIVSTMLTSQAGSEPSDRIPSTTIKHAQAIRAACAERMRQVLGATVELPLFR